MKVYELVKSLNTKVSIKSSDVMSVKKYYLSLYRAYMVSMYDKGYISDPTVFNRREILKNVVDMNIQYLSGVSGKIELSTDYIGFALSRNKGNTEITNFLSLLLKAVTYRGISMNIDKFYDDVGLSNSSKKKISFNIAQGASRIYLKSGYDLDEGVLKCIHGITSESEFVSLEGVIYETALEELGLSDISGDEALFVSGLSREEEIKYSRLILNGLVNLDGKYSGNLTSWLKKNKWSNGNKFSSQNEGLYNWILFVKTTSMIEEQSKLLNLLVDEGKEIVGVTSNGFYVSNESCDIDVPIGVFSVMSDYDEDVVLPEINRLEGYTGEAYLLDFLDENDINYVGCPIELFIKDNRKALFIDKEQTDMNDSITWFKFVDASVSFDEEYSSTSSKYGEESVEGKLYSALVLAERGVLITNISSDDYLSITDSMKKGVIKSFE